MKQSTRISLGLLGVAHVLVAIALLPVATFVGFFSVVVVLPAMIWLAILGFRLWRPTRALRRLLRVTHLLLGPVAVLLVVYGLFCLHAARGSAEGGGGLLGAVGLIPIVMGSLAGILSIVSLCVSFSHAFNETTEAEQSLGGDSGKAADGLTGAPQV